MKWHSVAIAALIVAGCGGSGEPEPSAEPEGEAASVGYSQLESNVGERVKTVAWVLGEGESYRLEGTFVFALVPSAEMDWAGFFADHDEMQKLADSLEGDADRTAGAGDVERYTRLQRAVNGWNAQVRSIEKAATSTAWGHCRQNVLTARYDAIGDTPLVLVTPRRGELKAAADKVWARYEQIAKSAELELTGRVLGSEDWSEKHNANSTMATAAKTKPIVVEVESYKVLRTARQAMEGPQGRGVEDLHDPNVDPGYR